MGAAACAAVRTRPPGGAGPADEARDGPEGAEEDGLHGRGQKDHGKQRRRRSSDETLVPRRHVPGLAREPPTVDATTSDTLHHAAAPTDRLQVEGVPESAGATVARSMPSARIDSRNWTTGPPTMPATTAPRRFGEGHSRRRPAAPMRPASSAWLPVG